MLVDIIRGICKSTNAGSNLLCIGILILTLTSPLLSQIITVDGTMNNLSSAKTYMLTPDDGKISPLVIGVEEGKPLQFILCGIRGLNIYMVFTLPTTLTTGYLYDTQVPASFNPTSAYVKETGEYFNPNIPFTIAAGLNDTITVNIGITVSIPEICLIQTFSGKVTIAAINIDTGTLIDRTASAAYETNVWCEEWGGPFSNMPTITGLLRGHMYTILPDSSGSTAITPRITGDEAGSPLKCEFYVDSGATLQFSYTLPSQLIDENGAVIPCTFSNKAIYVKGRREFFDPHRTNSFYATIDQKITLALGIQIAISISTPPGEYFGEVGYDYKISGFQKKTFWGDGFIVVVGAPTQCKLYQNYPNPFNPATRIVYDLPEAAQVDLSIYNMLGQRVSSLVQQTQPAGVYEVQWLGTNYASGMYMYKLDAYAPALGRKYTQSKKMILAR
jgi:hypothetical protein